MKKIILYFNIIILFFFSTKVYLNNQFPYTHDGENHLVRFANYKVALKQGQIPPRFAPNVNSGYGNPVFNYNYPLANILSIPFSYLKINYQLTFKILVVSFLLVGLISLSKIFRLFNFNQEQSFLGLNIYLLSPYLLNLIYFRGNIGEILALNLLAPIFYFLLKYEKYKEMNKKDRCFLIFYLTLFLHSHNIAALYGFFILIIYVLIFYLKDLKKIGYLFSHFFIALLLTAWFYLPALLEKNLVNLDLVSLNNSYIDHYPTLSQLLFSPLKFGFSYLGSIDGLSFSLNLINIIFFFLFFCYFFNYKFNKKNKFIYFCFFLSLFLFFFQLRISHNFISNLFFKFIQFPWRLGLFFSFFSIFPAVFIYRKIGTNWQKLFVFFILVQTMFLFKTKPADFFKKSNIDYDSSSISTTTQNEINARNFTYNDLGVNPRRPFFINNEDDMESFNIISYNGSYREYKVESDQLAVVIEPTMNFLGWETKVNNKKVKYLNDKKIGGRIAFEIPKGKSKIITRFKQKSFIRRFANLISFLAFLIYLSVCFYEKKRN
jgi:hypothetical protein